MLVLGLKDRTSLEYLLVTGGIIESLPALIYLVTAALSAFLSIRERRFLPWGIYSFFCFFLAGEEAGWGRESILGWQILNKSDSLVANDLHNFVSHLLSQNTPSRIFYVPAFFVMLLAVIVVVAQQAIYRGWPRWFRVGKLSRQFIIAGIFLVLFGLVDMLQDFGLPYLPGQWTLEESCELLGAIALLFAVIVKFLEPKHR